MGSAALLVPSTSTPDPWAGGCPIWTHSTAVSSTTTVGSQCWWGVPVLLPLHPVTEVTSQPLKWTQAMHSPFYF